jgi:hypothetical protein
VPIVAVVEDGTGKADGQAFCDVAYVTDYAAARGLVFTGTADQLNISVIKGGDWLANELRLQYVGTRQYGIQRMPWPRTGGSEISGQTIPDGFIPWRLKDANAELAILDRAGIVLQSDLQNGGLQIQTKTIDVLTTTWFKPERFQILSPIPGETVRVTIMGFLAPLLRNLGPQRTEPAVYIPVDTSPYIPGQFDFIQ